MSFFGAKNATEAFPSDLDTSASLHVEHLMFWVSSRYFSTLKDVVRSL